MTRLCDNCHHIVITVFKTVLLLTVFRTGSVSASVCSASI